MLLTATPTSIELVTGPIGGRVSGPKSDCQRSARMNTATASTASEGTNHQRFASANASLTSPRSTPADRDVPEDEGRAERERPEEGAAH